MVSLDAGDLLLPVGEEAAELAGASFTLEGFSELGLTVLGATMSFLNIALAVVF